METTPMEFVPAQASAGTSERDAALGELRAEAPDLMLRLAGSSDPREALRAWLEVRRQQLLDAHDGLESLDRDHALECVRHIEDLSSAHNEERVGFSTVALLADVLRGRGFDAQSGFLLEWVHLLRGANGRAGVHHGWLGPILRARGFSPLEPGKRGLEASIERSDYLDAMAEEVERQLSRHPTGLDEAVVAARASNRRRILEHLEGNVDDWEDYRWHLRHLFTGPAALERLTGIVALAPDEREAIQLCLEHGVPFGITPHYLSLFDLDRTDRGNDLQVRSQVIPPLFYVRRMIEHQDERRSYFDFMGEDDTSPAELITRRYPLIAILKGLDTCPQICVYCQRNFEIEGPMCPAGFPSTSTIDEALDWFEAHEGIRDVLVTGGDPIFVGSGRIEHVMDRLAAMPHVIQVRWGTRAFVSLPQRIDDALAELLGRYVDPGRRAVSLVTHVESAFEVTPDTAAAVSRVKARGLPVFNQEVFTVAASRRFASAALRAVLVRAGIEPYYSFYPKGKEETREYRTPIARLLQERKEEARLLPGLFRTDEPVFNVPRIGKNHVRASQDRRLVGIRPDGARLYAWHPWEKAIAPAEPHLYEDVPIREYLDRLGALGEDLEDYASIWSYY